MTEWYPSTSVPYFLPASCPGILFAFQPVSWIRSPLERASDVGGQAASTHMCARGFSSLLTALKCILCQRQETHILRGDSLPLLLSPPTSSDRQPTYTSHHPPKGGEACGNHSHRSGRSRWNGMKWAERRTLGLEQYPGVRCTPTFSLGSC